MLPQPQPSGLSCGAVIQRALTPSSSNQPSSIFWRAPAQSPPCQSAMSHTSSPRLQDAAPSFDGSPFAKRSTNRKYSVASSQRNGSSSIHTGSTSGRAAPAELAAVTRRESLLGAVAPRTLRYRRPAAATYWLARVAPSSTPACSVAWTLSASIPGAPTPSRTRTTASTVPAAASAVSDSTSSSGTEQSGTSSLLFQQQPSPSGSSKMRRGLAGSRSQPSVPAGGGETTSL